MEAEAGAWLGTAVVRSVSNTHSSLGGRAEDLDSRQASPMERILLERSWGPGWLPDILAAHPMEPTKGTDRCVIEEMKCLCTNTKIPVPFNE